MDCLAGAARAREQGITKGTQAKQSRAWSQWLDFLKRIEVPTDDPYLDVMCPNQRLGICCAFMHAQRIGHFGPGRYSHQKVGSTARKALDDVAAVFVESHRRNPIVDSRGRVHTNVDRQTRGYKRTDPATKHEKALRHRLRHSPTTRAKARANLVAGALFFAKRSCEYLYVGPTDERKTRAIRVRDIVFRKNNRVVAHDDPLLEESDSVDVTFGDQKTEVKDETVSQDNNHDPELNLVRNIAYTIRRLRSYPGFSPDWPIYKFFDGQTFSNITSREVLVDIRASVTAIGFETLGYTAEVFIRNDALPSTGTNLHDHATGPLELGRIPRLHRETGQRVHEGSKPSNAGARNVLQHAAPTRSRISRAPQQEQSSPPNPPIESFWPQGFAQTPAPTTELATSAPNLAYPPCRPKSRKAWARAGLHDYKTRSSRALLLLATFSDPRSDAATLGRFVPVGISRRSVCA